MKCYSYFNLLILTLLDKSLLPIITSNYLNLPKLIKITHLNITKQITSNYIYLYLPILT